MIKLTENYAIKSDGSLNWQIFELKTVDPTNAPGWKRKVAEAEETGAPPPDPTPRTEWHGMEAYFGRLDQALSRVIDLEGLRSKGEYLPEITARLTELHEAIATIVSARDFSAIKQA